jgi:hypothetical protein
LERQVAGQSSVNLAIADLYSEALGVLRADPGKFAALSAIGLAPSWIASLMSGSFVVSFIVLAVSLPIVALANGALVVLVTSLRNRKTMPLRELLSGPRDGFVRLTVAYVLLSLVLGIGFILLLVPGLVALAFLWIAWPLVVLEEASGIEAMKRSAAIVDGYKLTITGIILVLIGIYLGLGIAQVTITGILGPTVGVVLGALVGILVNSLALTLVTLSYHRFKEAATSVVPAD